jgi:cytidylate kinase
MTHPLSSNPQPRKGNLIIAIDGPSAAGKTTLAKLLAERLGYLHLDTGAMYRAVGWKASKTGVPFDDVEQITEIAKNIKIRFSLRQEGENRVIADGQDVTTDIRSPQAGEWASRVSAIPGVRRAMVALQRQAGAGGGIVAEGRDMQTVVFPNAEVKIFLIASVRERALRRYKEFKEKGMAANLEEIERDMQKRDERDSTRADSPLKAAPDAVLLDTDGKSIDEVVAEVMGIVQEKILKA